MKEEWFEQHHTNDTRAGNESEEGDPKTMLQLWWRQLYPAGRDWTVSLSAAHHKIAYLQVVPHSGSAGRAWIRAGASAAWWVQALRRVRRGLLLCFKPEQVLRGMCGKNQTAAAGGIRKTKEGEQQKQHIKRIN